MPDWVWQSWNLPPLVLLLVVACLYGLGVTRLWRRAGAGKGIGYWQVAAFCLGLTALAAALASPLEAASGLLFSAHMVQHMLLAFIAAPLLAWSVPGLGVLWSLPPGTRKGFGRWWRRNPAVRRILAALTHPATVFILFTATFWLWHAPPLYEAAIRHELLHYVEHAMMFGSAWLFWWLVLQPTGRRRLPLGATVLFLLGATLQGSVLASLIAFASYPLYGSYELAAGALGISALADQQLAGMIMRTPSAVILLLTTAGVFLAWIAQMERRDLRA